VDTKHYIDIYIKFTEAKQNNKTIKIYYLIVKASAS